ncbi:hypothetical protein AXG93_1467s1000 [Marchantia polymorpha subsp. ruderalis]|uniref:Uncharacterized protein n=1 Tax=Marchantia polymorpha subsp. ruderalis TaxID=1480154 RepID=A0A176WK05_MARPO|nr:hypothetical protein AXG93_1467s1000 [Marchantia polymorpha subsp. ruderalis]
MSETGAPARTTDSEGNLLRRKAENTPSALDAFGAREIPHNSFNSSTPLGQVTPYGTPSAEWNSCGKSAFGGTREINRKDKDQLTTVNAFGLSAFGDAPTSTDVYKDSPLALRVNAFGSAGKDRDESRPKDMVREWQKERDQPTRGFRPHVERWVIADWEQVLGRCAGEDGHLLFDSESIKVTKEEEISFAALFKSSKSSKNGYKTRDYKDRYRRNVVVALLQLL